MGMLLYCLSGRLFVLMTALVQQIIVYVILAIVAIVILVKIIRNVSQKGDVTTCNCGNCPQSDCCGQKKVQVKCKKTEKNIASSDK